MSTPQETGVTINELTGPIWFKLELGFQLIFEETNFPEIVGYFTERDAMVSARQRCLSLGIKNNQLHEEPAILLTQHKQDAASGEFYQLDRIFVLKQLESPALNDTQPFVDEFRKVQRASALAKLTSAERHILGL